MCWYAAHIIEYLKFLDGKQNNYEVYENIVLIEAETTEAAFAEAKKLGQKYEVEVTVGPENRPARWTFAGIRTLVECQNITTDSLAQPLNFKPLHGTEITYIPMTVDSEEALVRLVEGQAVNVTLDDMTPLTAEDIADILNPVAGKSQK
jgi:hypothetical protein